MSPDTSIPRPISPISEPPLSVFTRFPFNIPISFHQSTKLPSSTARGGKFSPVVSQPSSLIICHVNEAGQPSLYAGGAGKVKLSQALGATRHKARATNKKAACLIRNQTGGPERKN